MAAILRGSPFRATRFATILLGSTMLAGDALIPNGGAPTGPMLQFLGIASNTVTEGTTAGQLVGALTGLTPGSTLSLVDSAGSRFALSGTSILTGSTATDYEAFTVHEITVRETLAGVVNSPKDSTISIFVLNVNELPALSALSVPGSAIVGSTLNISGATAGSTLTGTMPSGWTLNSAARTISVAAGAATGSQSWSITETLGDSPNSPRTSTGTTTVSAAASYEAETVAYVAAMTTPPSTADQNRIDTLVKSLKSAGVLSKLQWLALHAAHDAQAGRINLVNPTQVAIAVNSPTFTQYRGFTGDGATSYLNTGYSVGGTPSPFSANDASMGAWVGTDVTSATAHDIGARTGRTGILSRTNATSAGYAANVVSAGTVALPVATSVGHTSWSRSNSADYVAFKNGTALQTITATTATSVAPLLIGAGWNTTTSAPANFSSRRIQATHFGPALNSTEMAALYNALNTYMASLP